MSLPKPEPETESLLDYRLRIGRFVQNRLEEVQNSIGGVIGYKLVLSPEETEKFIREIEK